jgi:hypothetical protein
MRQRPFLVAHTAPAACSPGTAVKYLQTLAGLASTACLPQHRHQAAAR